MREILFLLRQSVVAALAGGLLMAGVDYLAGAPPQAALWFGLRIGIFFLILALAIVGAFLAACAGMAQRR